MQKSRRSTEPSLRAQWLGKLLRDLRNERGLTLDQAAEYLQRNGSMLSRYETGEFPIRRGDVLALMTLYSVGDPTHRDRLIQLSDDIWKKGWWEPYVDDLGTAFINHPWLESRALCLRTYHSMFVPGLLQTSEYAEAMIRNADDSGVSEEQFARWVELRVERQRVLTGPRPLKLSVVIEEWALRRPIGDRKVARAQLHRLRELSIQENIDIHVMPADHGSHAGNAGTFEFFEMPDPYPEVAYVESLGGAIYVEQPRAERFRRAYDDLHRNALSSSRSTKLISAITEDL